MDSRTNKRIQQYVLCHLGQACEDVAELTRDILELTAHSSRNPSGPKERAETARALAREELEYIEQGTKDLRALEAR